ncbi:MAG: helix-turn-helix transcriptional regulator [Gammaproteobacteria bacterium]
MDIKLTNHPTLTLAPEVQAICKPLQQYFNTSYFNFVRRFVDGSEACLSTDPRWTEYFYSNKLYQHVMSDKIARNKALIHRIKIVPWTHFQDSPVRLAQSKLTNVGIGISIIFARDEYADFFHFATDNNNHGMQELYQSFADCLIQFTHYFYDNASKLIQIVTKKENRLYLDDRIKYQSDRVFPCFNNFNIDTFLQDIQHKRFYLYSPTVGDVYLSKAELRCITLLAQGKTAREIGDMLFRSNRTIESHIQNARTKLGLQTGASKADLITEIYRCGFDLHEIAEN